ncbi:hypothetical protein ACFLR1_03910 [Bacteroidota bacterium]
MKRSILQILGVAAVATIGMVSCNVDACKDVECGDNGICVEGVCICDAGYEGADCATLSAEKFEGDYQLNEADCNLQNYNTSIAASKSGADKIAITGFGGFACGASDIVVIATVSGDDVTIASQSFCDGSIVINSGSGSIDENGIITITYNSTWNLVTSDCTAVFTAK